MAGFLSDSQKKSIQAVFKTIHETFERDIIVYTLARTTFVVTDNAYNALYGTVANPQTTETQTVVPTKYKGRIHYVGRALDQYMGEMRANGVLVGLPAGVIRIKIEEAGKHAFTNAEYVKVDDENYELISGTSIIGPFGVQYYEVFLQRSLSSSGAEEAAP